MSQRFTTYRARVNTQWATNNGTRVTVLARIAQDYLICQIHDPHVIEGLTYPANARWLFAADGTFLWYNDGRATRTELDNLKLVEEWSEELHRPKKVKSTQIEAVELPQTLINPDIPELPKKKNLLQRIIGG